MLTSFQSAPEPGTATYRLLRVVEVAFSALAIAPAAFVAWQAFVLLRNIPMWDEFETVLKFLVSYESMASLWDAVGPILSLANEHCMVTSRLIVLTLFELTGEANFIHLAIIGNLSVLGVVILLVRQESNRLIRPLQAALTSLLIFQLQHHENFFSSYASIDHFLVVFLTTACLVWVVRGGALALWCAGLMASLAVFTLAHGVAVLAAAALVLAMQQRWRHLGGWMLGGLLTAGLFAWRLSSADMVLTPALNLEGIGKIITYWLSLLGGVPALGSPVTAVPFGVLQLLLVGWTTVQASWRKDPLLWGVAINAMLGSLLIAYGRADAVDVSPLSSRYMIQSAMAWSACLIMLLKLLDSPWRVLGWGGALVVVVAAANVAATARFLPGARDFVQRRIDAARQYDLIQSLDGMKAPIFPRGRDADAILASAASRGVFQLEPRRSTESAVDVPLKEQALLYHLDRVAVSRRNLHVRGWMVTPDRMPSDLRPHLLLRNGDQRFLFRGRREFRPDVVRALSRPDAERSGFYFVIPLHKLPSAELAVALALKGKKRGVFSNTDHRVTIPETAEPLVMRTE
mgnify:CR=1 FL=1